MTRNYGTDSVLVDKTFMLNCLSLYLLEHVDKSSGLTPRQNRRLRKQLIGKCYGWLNWKRQHGTKTSKRVQEILMVKVRRPQHLPQNVNIWSCLGGDGTLCVFWRKRLFCVFKLRREIMSGLQTSPERNTRLTLGCRLEEKPRKMCLFDKKTWGGGWSESRGERDTPVAWSSWQNFGSLKMVSVSVCVSYLCFVRYLFLPSVLTPSQQSLIDRFQMSKSQLNTPKLRKGINSQQYHHKVVVVKCAWNSDFNLAVMDERLWGQFSRIFEVLVTVQEEHLMALLLSPCPLGRAVIFQSKKVKGRRSYFLCIVLGTTRVLGKWTAMHK